MAKGKGWHGDSAGHSRAARKRKKTRSSSSTTKFTEEYGYRRPPMTTRTASIKAKRAKRNKLAKKRAKRARYNY